jgi:hypothetical protein
LRRNSGRLADPGRDPAIHSSAYCLGMDRSSSVAIAKKSNLEMVLKCYMQAAASRETSDSVGKGIRNSHTLRIFNADWSSSLGVGSIKPYQHGHTRVILVGKDRRIPYTSRTISSTQPYGAAMLTNRSH